MSPADKTTILNALALGKCQVSGQFVNGSNYTFLADVKHGELALRAVYKPLRGEQPLWDFPEGTLCRREVAAYRLSDFLGWDLVPPTVFRSRGPLGRGSLQQYIDHDPEYHFFKFTPEDRQCLRAACLFDLLINNADRKGGHVLKDAQGHFWLIDHGVCFHVEDKLRTVIWDFAGEPIPSDLLDDLRRLNVPEQETALRAVLSGMLRVSEVNALLQRAQALVANAVFPLPDPNRRSYPWPPV